MKSLKKLPIAIAFLIVFTISFTPTYAAVPSKILLEPARNEVVWGTGAATGAGKFQPFAADPDPWVSIMYETLWGKNTYTGDWIPVLALGEPTWGAGGNTITVNINPAAMWSDGTPVNATDVVKSYELANQTAKFSNELFRFQSVVAADNDTVTFTLNGAYAYSKMALNLLTRDLPIVPWSIWEVINDTYGGLIDLFLNDWMNPTFNADWKVTSGPYTPVYRDAIYETTVFQYRDDWWGEGEIYQDLPSIVAADTRAFPKYVGHKVLTDNADKTTAFINGALDLNSGSISGIWNIWQSPKNDFDKKVASYYGQVAPYYPSLGGTICIGVNLEHGKATGTHGDSTAHAPSDNILLQSWFRQAIGYAIKYDLITQTDKTSYWKRAMPGFLDNVAHASVYNPATAVYYKTYDPTTADAIMTAHGLTRNGAGQWAWANGTLAVGDGMTMMVQQGWDDVVIFSDFVCDDLQAWGLNVQLEEVDISTTDGLDLVFGARVVARDYDFMLDCGGAHNALDEMLYFKKLQDAPSWGANVTGWYNATWLADYATLETESVQATYEATVDEMQMILAREQPSIPCFVNCYFYAYSSYFWEGWVSSDNPFQQAVTEATNDQFAVKTRMILNLRATGKTSITTGGIPWTGLEIFMLIGLVSTIVLAGFKIKKSRK